VYLHYVTSPDYREIKETIGYINPDRLW